MTEIIFRKYYCRYERIKSACVIFSPLKINKGDIIFKPEPDPAVDYLMNRVFENALKFFPDLKLEDIQSFNWYDEYENLRTAFLFKSELVPTPKGFRELVVQC